MFCHNFGKCEPTIYKILLPEETEEMCYVHYSKMNPLLHYLVSVFQVLRLLDLISHFLATISSMVCRSTRTT